ncbi:hypothetical protein RASY3_04030 [Ruminococcus albus SY3]|uniref:Uncharacterized protein n=1 Tax=Ruminococcus albus SY3 TaxID=1341156 RepID=A0A011UKE1_RUMAL|nr:hypothetical protein [Ruminococcus albus]EXM41094.1 hypothetical protein RASY3_04030 [Ruminococcus albus SY3]
MKKNKNTILWILGWIFIFPIPLTLLLRRNKNINKKAKYVIIGIAWVIYLIVFFRSMGSNNTKQGTNHKETANNVTLQKSNTENTNETNVETPNSTTVSESSSETEASDNSSIENTIVSLVENYNATAKKQLIYSEDFVVSSTDSGHYRTEFRLPAFKNAVGKSYNIDDYTIDIIEIDKLGDFETRIYSDNISLDQCLELIQYFSPLLDSSLSNERINETLEYVSEKKNANGYYYGNLVILLSKTNQTSYSFMMRTD